MTGSVLTTIEYRLHELASGSRSKLKPYIVTVEGLLNGQHKFCDLRFETEELAKAALQTVVDKFVDYVKEEFPNTKICKVPFILPAVGVKQQVIMINETVQMDPTKSKTKCFRPDCDLKAQFHITGEPNGDILVTCSNHVMLGTPTQAPLHNTVWIVREL